MSIFDHPDAVPTAPSWRCPHCHTLQPEASHCRACARAPVTCSTCSRYRSSVATGFGFCVGDGGRAPLSGDEVRACWESAPPLGAAPGFFDEVDISPSPVRVVAPVGVHDAPVRAPDELPAAAWCDTTPPGRLVDAPHVAPGRRLMSEVERRSRRSRET